MIELPYELMLQEAEREIDRHRDEIIWLRKQLSEAALLLESAEPGRDIYADIEQRGRWKLRRDRLLVNL